jgi:hypothetical protein
MGAAAGTSTTAKPQSGSTDTSRPPNRAACPGLVTTNRVPIAVSMRSGETSRHRRVSSTGSSEVSAALSRKPHTSVRLRLPKLYSRTRCAIQSASRPGSSVS